MTIHVRGAVAADAERLADWACAMALETEHKRLHRETVLRGIRTVIAEPARGRYFVAERELPFAGAEVARVPVGTLMLTYEWSDWRCGDWWWIQSVYVDPAHRRQGVYAALYRHVHALADAAGESVCGLRLYVEKENATAQRTYRSLGMEDAGYFMYEAAMPWLGKVIGKD
jgi:GNAT superfamily N-acetyltransferase